MKLAKIVFFWAMLALITSVAWPGLQKGVEVYASVAGWNWRSQLLFALGVIVVVGKLWEGFDSESTKTGKGEEAARRWRQLIAERKERGQ